MNPKLKCVLQLVNACISLDATKWTRKAKRRKGINEGTATCVSVLQEMATEGELVFTVINVSNCVTKSKFGNVRGCRSLLFDVPLPVAR